MHIIPYINKLISSSSSWHRLYHHHHHPWFVCPVLSHNHSCLHLQLLVVIINQWLVSFCVCLVFVSTIFNKKLIWQLTQSSIRPAKMELLLFANWERVSVSLLMLSTKHWNHWYHLLTSLVWRGSWSRTYGTLSNCYSFQYFITTVNSNVLHVLKALKTVWILQLNVQQY